uniref:hypothetical protein n=1 Tax=Hydrogenophaga sp. TaxID=1904254 RepID=UPI0025C3E83E
LQFSGAGMDAFLTQVSKRQINTSAVRRAPAGSGLQKQKLLSLTGHRAWVFDFLSRGYVAGVGQRTVLEHFPRETVVDFDVLEDSSKSYLGRHAENRSQIANVMNILHDYFGDSVRLTDSAGIRCVVFPSIEALRTSFSKKVGNPDFDWDLLR